MSRREAERFEEALQRAAEGEAIEGHLAPLVNTARQATRLAQLPPPPPRRLSPGRQRILAEGARLRIQKTKRRKERMQMTPMMKMGTALLSAVLVLGLVVGVGYAASDSLPGEPLYGLKTAIQEARQALTTDAQAEANLNRNLAEQRLDEAAKLLEQGQGVDDAAAARVQQQLGTALRAAAELAEPAGPQALERLAAAIQQRLQRMERLAGESPEEPLRQMLWEMERVRQEAHAGQGDPEGLRHRLRDGEPTGPEDIPGSQDAPGPQGPQGPSEQTGEGPGSEDAPGPYGPQPEEKPGEAKEPGGPPEDSPGDGDGEPNQPEDGGPSGDQPGSGDPGNQTSPGGQPEDPGQGNSGGNEGESGGNSGQSGSNGGGSGGSGGGH